MTKFAASDAGREFELANRDLLVHKLVRKVVRSLSHGAYENTNTLVCSERLDVVSHMNHLGIEAERDLPAVGWQVIGDGVVYDAEQFLLRFGTLDREPVQELNHQAREALERARKTNRRRDLDEHAPGCVDVDL
jgi:hypothetical protein